MTKYFNPFWIFSFFAAVFGLLYGWSPSEGVLVPSFYAALFAFRLPRELKPKDLFPLIMLFLFLLILSEAPTRLFTSSLIYAAQGLILFRGLLLVLVQIQNQKEKVKKETLLFISGLSFEFILVAIMLYSTFKSVSPIVLTDVRLLRVAPLLLLGTWATRLQWAGGVLAILCFIPLTHVASILLFGAGVLVYGIKTHEQNFS